ncbi:NADH dehydrogenase [ubiquinone] 1 alpha subcomplex subunit 8 [Coccinella septempunctata]|uniref:NADH dehydrogenase [ubiquinone] 1 alpha subcomplex subunit 8 n=1 Tax=Coccinella septempunctata TaxID=41139 RepID=UPI001D0688C6|nr:NADH dehydrogenase [ubiquinone] 1 alpha subcomplex subunit 8 [Coccinella septempunctata]
MSITEETYLPTDDELTVQEVNLSGPVLKAAAFHYGLACLNENNEFMLCRKETNDPRACLNEGKAVTNCALNFFRQVKKSCAEEFQQYYTCIDKSSINQSYSPCRKTQGVFDKCMKDNLNLERAPFDYFARVQVHKTDRPRPPVEPIPHYPDTPASLPPDAPKPPAKYGSRYLGLW